MAQPPLSVHIKNLEAAVGTPLFRRAARGMEITDAGNALFQRAKEALLLANEGFDAARAIGSGSWAWALGLPAAAASRDTRIRRRNIN